MQWYDASAPATESKECMLESLEERLAAGRHSVCYRELCIGIVANV